MQADESLPQAIKKICTDCKGVIQANLETCDQIWKKFNNLAIQTDYTITTNKVKTHTHYSPQEILRDSDSNESYS